MLARAAVQAGPLGRGRLLLLRRLADATDSTKQAPTTRAKAVKALGAVVRVDAGLLALPEVQAGVSRALKVLTPVLLAIWQSQHAKSCMPLSAGRHSPTHAAHCHSICGGCSRSCWQAQ